MVQKNVERETAFDLARRGGNPVFDRLLEGAGYATGEFRGFEYSATQWRSPMVPITARAEQALAGGASELEALRERLMRQIATLRGINPTLAALQEGRVATAGKDELQQLTGELARILSEARGEQLIGAADVGEQAHREELLRQRQALWHEMEKEQDDAFARATALYREGKMSAEQYEDLRQHHEAVLRDREELRAKHGDNWASDPNADTRKLDRDTRAYTGSVQRSAELTGDLQLQAHGQELGSKQSRLSALDRRLAALDAQAARDTPQPPSTASKITPATDHPTEEHLSHLASPSFNTATNSQDSRSTARSQGAVRG